MSGAPAALMGSLKYLVVNNEEHLKKLQKALEETASLRSHMNLLSTIKFPSQISKLRQRLAVLSPVCTESPPTQGGAWMPTVGASHDINSVISSYLRIVYRNFSHWSLFHQEVTRVEQFLVTKPCSNTAIYQQIHKFFKQHQCRPGTTSKQNIQYTTEIR